MPELPEVETIKRGLTRKILNKKIIVVEIKKPHLIKNKIEDFTKCLQNNAISNIDRRGKLLVCTLKNKDKFLLIHLKMTGQLIYQNKKPIIAGGHSFVGMDWHLPNKFSHIIITFNDKSQLFFNDARQFGYMHLVEKDELQQILSMYGIEPLSSSFTLSVFKEILNKKRSAIKIILMNQSLIAGIGNIYASEICFFAKVKPNRSAISLNETEIKNLYKGCKMILKKAVEKKGTTFSDYLDVDSKKGSFINFLKVYQKSGEECKRCKKGIIKKTKIGGRGTYYCDYCQY